MFESDENSLTRHAGIMAQIGHDHDGHGHGVHNLT